MVVQNAWVKMKQFKENYPNIPLEALANGEGIKSEYIQEYGISAGMIELKRILPTVVTKIL